MPDRHFKLIEELCENFDIRDSIIQHIDFDKWEEELERKEKIRNKVYNRRWKRKSNHYDSLKFNNLGR
jgi:preprotein translocase subunit SecA